MDFGPLSILIANTLLLMFRLFGRELAECRMGWVDAARLEERRMKAPTRGSFASGAEQGRETGYFRNNARLDDPGVSAKGYALIRTLPSTSCTSYTLSALIAGPLIAAPVAMSKREPWHWHIIVVPRASPRRAGTPQRCRYRDRRKHRDDRKHVRLRSAACDHRGSRERRNHWEWHRLAQAGGRQ